MRWEISNEKSHFKFCSTSHLSKNLIWDFAQVIKWDLSFSSFSSTSQMRFYLKLRFFISSWDFLSQSKIFHLNFRFFFSSWDFSWSQLILISYYNSLLLSWSVFCFSMPYLTFSWSKLSNSGVFHWSKQLYGNDCWEKTSTGCARANRIPSSASVLQLEWESRQSTHAFLHPYFANYLVLSGNRGVACTVSLRLSRS